MNSFALAHDFRTNDRRRSGAGRKRLPVVALPWTDVPVTRFVSPITGEGRIRWVPASLLVALAIAAHTSFVWYVGRHAITDPVPPRKHEVAVEIVTPPPPSPKVEPPKPPPPRVVKRQVLPQIQTSAPETPAVESTPTEPSVPVAVAAPEPAPPPPPPAPEPVTAPFGRAGYLNNPPPNYPAMAVRQGWQGTVLLKVRVLSTGRVESVEVQKSSGHKLLDEEALATVRSWQFTPSKRGSTPIDGWATVPIEFKLDT